MKDKDKLDGKIKSSFESLNKKAPDMLWNQLSDSLNTEPAGPAQSQPENNRLYNKVRESFSSLHQKAPQHVWRSINRQLNIDLVWSRLSSELDHTPSVSWQYGRWAAVLLLFVLSSAGAFYLYRQQPDVLYTERTERKLREPSTLATKQEVLKDAPQQQTEPLTENGQEGNEQEESMQAHASRNVHEAVSRGDKIAATTKGGHQLKASLAENENVVIPPTAKTYTSPIGKNFEATERRSLTSIPYQVEKLGMANPLFQKIVFFIPPPAMDSLAAELLAKEELKKETEKEPNHFSFGPLLAYNNSWLLNNETRKSFDKGSLIARSPTFKNNLGLALYYSFNQKNAVATEFHFISKAGQEYNTFSDGYYREMGLELSYYKLYMQYQRNFFPHRQGLFSDLTAKAGFYSGLLHRKEGEIRDTESTYSNFDFGVRFGLGQEKRLNRLVIGYGISGERGLTNIFMGSDKMPARFNKTYTFNVGPYLNLRYRL